ncbi:hypothetical protein LEP1GSC055_1217 [Leptospira borgpetersenii str. Brem 307]|uniref:Uncharacterized protein n=1 Tax=Leptospira borgpetersenii str. Brem 328 TaxID=1049780 RepID=A0ABC9SHX2_LEPBO|nr:hypothetical protein LEP1GSC055_1217 [Leptospira borgpetersenii str. Brem 307]EMN17428.1 hypothetical protein LEP1GSC056_3901 [Leptospira borgpetersenii str. Brem 328]
MNLYGKSFRSIRALCISRVIKVPVPVNGSKLNHFLDSKGFIDEELRLPDFATDLAGKKRLIF